jgi:hypothetical protein
MKGYYDVIISREMICCNQIDEEKGDLASPRLHGHSQLQSRQSMRQKKIQGNRTVILPLPTST